MQNLIIFNWITFSGEGEDCSSCVICEKVKIVGGFPGSPHTSQAEIRNKLQRTHSTSYLSRFPRFDYPAKPALPGLWGVSSVTRRPEDR